RSERKIELTDVGRVVHAHALQLLQVVEDIYQSADALAHTARGSIQLGVMPTIGVLLFPKVLANFRKAYPQIELFIDRKSTRLNSSHVSISYAVFCLKKKK